MNTQNAFLSGFLHKHKSCNYNTSLIEGEIVTAYRFEDAGWVRLGLLRRGSISGCVSIKLCRVTLVMVRLDADQSASGKASMVVQNVTKTQQFLVSSNYKCLQNSFSSNFIPYLLLNLTQGTFNSPWPCFKLIYV